VEYVHAPVTSDVDLDMDVEMSIREPGEDHVWLPAEWTGEVGTTRTARTAAPVDFSIGNYPASSYDVCVRLTDSPEVPIVDAGDLTIT
jgi:hypothetical protein